MPEREADDLIEQIAGATARLIESNVALLGRLLDGSGAPPDEASGRGPVEDAWLTWADGAGDLVTVAYLSAQLADVLGVFPGPSARQPAPDTHPPGHQGRGESGSNGRSSG